MKYPTKLVEVQGFTVFIPDPALVKSTYEALLEMNPQTAFPFWAKLWASSIALSDFLKSNTQLIQDKIVLEIGAGIGLPSLSISSFAKEIIISDYDLDAVKLMELNIAHLGLQNLNARCLDWNHFPKNLNADVILLSDINYAPNEFESLITLIEEYLNRGTQIIIATPQRIMGSPFIQRIAHLITQSYMESIIESNKNIDIHIYLLLREKEN